MRKFTGNQDKLVLDFETLLNQDQTIKSIIGGSTVVPADAESVGDKFKVSFDGQTELSAFLEIASSETASQSASYEATATQLNNIQSSVGLEEGSAILAAMTKGAFSINTGFSCKKLTLSNSSGYHNVPDAIRQIKGSITAPLAAINLLEQALSDNGSNLTLKARFTANNTNLDFSPKISYDHNTLSVTGPDGNIVTVPLQDIFQNYAVSTAADGPAARFSVLGIPLWLVALMGLILALGITIYYAYSLIMPPQAAQREAITTDGGNTVTIDDFDLWYRLYNAGSTATPIIVVAGGGGLSSNYMEDSLLFLADERPVLFYDGRGCGRSQIKPDLENYSVQISADEIEKLRHHFFPNRAVIVAGHSFGGIIAMNYAANYPDNLEKLILISSVNANYEPGMSMATTYLKTGLPPKDQLAANEWYMQKVDYFLGPYFQNQAAKTIFDNMLASYAVQMHVGSPAINLTSQMQTFNKPTLVLVGGDKEYPLTGVDAAQELTALLPNAHLEQLTSSGHFMFAEENEEFQRLTKLFLLHSA